MTYDIVEALLEHPNSARLIAAAQEELTRERAARRAFRAWLKPDMKAEFINGEVIVQSPALRRHNQVVRNLLFLIDSYISPRDLGEVAVEQALVELNRSDLEPDVCYWRKEVADTFNDELLYYPPPDLVVEILSKGTQGRDRGVKYTAYEDAQVPEYWIVDPKKRTLEQLLLQRDAADQLAYQAQGVLQINDSVRAQVLEGLSIPVRALFDVQARAEAVAEFVG